MKIFPENTIEKLGFASILEATLEKVYSDVARELIEELRPADSPREVISRLDRTSEGLRLIRSGENFPLGEVSDIRTALKRARPEGSVLDPLSLLHVGQILSMSRRIKQFFSQRNEQYPHWNEFCIPIRPLKNLEDEIFRIVSEHGGIRDNASPELQQIRRSINSRKNDLRNTLQRILRNAAKDGYLSEQEPTIRAGRMVLAVKSEHKRKISGFIHDESNTGQTVYLEPVEALHINNDIRQLESEEQREIERILKILTASLREYLTEIADNMSQLAAVDAGMGIVRLSAELDGVTVEVAENPPNTAQVEAGSDDRRGRPSFQLVRAHNPHLLLKAIKEGNRQTVVPLDLSLESTENCLVITGPNAGGKSVALKTIGLITLMTQSGFAVPVREGSKLPIFRALYVDMGDEQSIENDLSTFSSRLAWMKHTAIVANEHSMVLIDEAGTGTDPEEGVALYQSLLEQLIGAGSLTVVTTHHGNLKVFAHNHPRAVNASMEFDQESLSPTYRFRKGLPGSSYAFEIAQRTGVPASVLTRARTLIGDKRKQLENLIAELEKNTQEAANMRIELEKQLREADKTIQSYKEKHDSLTKERDKIREKALLEAKMIMQNANKRIEDAVRQIIEQKAGKQQIKEFRKDIETARDEVDRELIAIEESRAPKALGTPPEVGDTVRFADGHTTGELVGIDGKNATVLANGLKLRTKYQNLVKVQPPKKKEKANVVVITSTDGDDGIIRPVSSTIDLRGKRGDEAISELTYYLDKAITSGLGQVEVIHGKGDGILRKLVHAYLSDRKEVRDFALAPWEQGGPGCTLVYF